MSNEKGEDFFWIPLFYKEGLGEILYRRGGISLCAPHKGQFHLRFKFRYTHFQLMLLNPPLSPFKKGGRRKGHLGSSTTSRFIDDRSRAAVKSREHVIPTSLAGIT